MPLFKTISGVVKQATGSVSDFRKVLDLKPSLSSLVLPPQVSMGLKAANLIGGAIGVNIPSEDDIKAYAQGKLDRAIGGIYRDGSKLLDGVESKLENINGKLVKLGAINDSLKGKSSEEALNSIEWLL